jgi:ligand-binding sensor domain-containing protein/signal transduction histidine kinase
MIARTLTNLSPRNPKPLLCSALVVLSAIIVLVSCEREAASHVRSIINPLETGHSPIAPSANLQPLPVPSNPRFENLGLEEGLSQSTVFCVLQDSRGYLWFGTEDGLNRYDGYGFEALRPELGNPNSISGSRIKSVIEDHTGVIWIGSESGGVTSYDDRTEKFTRYRSGESRNSLLSDHVSVIIEDRNNALWIGTGSGISRLASDRNEFRHYSHEPGDPSTLGGSDVLSIYEDDEGVIWIGTADGGLSRFGNESDSFENYPIGTADESRAPNDIVTAIVEDRNGVLWVGTDGGLTAFDRETGQFGISSESHLSERLEGAKVNTIYEDHDKILWIGTWDDGLFVVDPDVGEIRHYGHSNGDPYGLNSGVVVSIFQDRERTLWIGLVAGGVDKLTADNRVFEYVVHDPNDENSLSHDWIRSVIEDKAGHLWVSTGGGGLNRYDPLTGFWRHYVNDPEDPASISSDFLSSVLEDSEGRIWIATMNGLDLFDPPTETFFHFRHDSTDAETIAGSNKVSLIDESSIGKLWLGTSGGGLDLFDTKTGIMSHYFHDPEDRNSLVHNRPWALLADQLGDVWIGTSAGLDRFDPATGSFTHFQPDPADPQSLNAPFIGTISEDKAGTLWIGTTGGGLNRFSKSDETFDHWTEDDGLINNTVYSIEEDDAGYLWLGTNKGLSRFSPEDETFANFGLTGGVPIVEFNGNVSFRSNSGELYFGGINGFISFDPRNARRNSYVPPVVITSLEHSNQSVEIIGGSDEATEITIRWPNDSFEFEYAALSFTNPERNQYAYRLDGFDDEWVDVGRSRAGRYARLPGGLYTFRVIGSNDDGLWNQSGVTVRIRVVPPFWESWGFRIAAVVLFVGAGIGAYGLRVRGIKDRNKRLEDTVENEVRRRLAAEEALHRAEMKSAVSAERSRLARDLHDSVTQSLYSLTLFIEATRELTEAGKLDQAKHGLARGADTATQALKEMRLLVYELRPLALKEEGLIGAIQHRLDAVERRAGVDTSMQVDGEIDVQLPDEVEEALFRVSQEALNNALKHAHASAITVRIGFSGNGGVELEVSDDGAGFNYTDAKNEGGLGLGGMAERAQSVGAILIVDSEPNEGTRIKLVLEKR